jgi:hypothetical protein
VSRIELHGQEKALTTFLAAQLFFLFDPFTLNLFGIKLNCLFWLSRYKK